MANEVVRIQIREDSTEHEWKDVGNKTGDQSVPARIKETVPTDATKNNPSLALSNADEVVDSTKTLTMTIGETSYESILSYNAAGDFLSMSEWSEV